MSTRGARKHRSTVRSAIHLRASVSFRSDTMRPITEAINNADNQIFCVNVVHIISQMSDVLCNACGGLLPLLASATSATVSRNRLQCKQGGTWLRRLFSMKLRS